MTSVSKQSHLHQFRLYLLGSFRLESVTTGSRRQTESQWISLPTRKVELLLAFLGLHPEPHPREKLAALVWGDSTDEQARNSLRNALSILRKHLDDDLLVVDRETVQLTPRFPLWVDAVEFKLQAQALLAAPQPDLDDVDLQLYRGDLLPDFYDDWVLAEREPLRLLYLETLLRLTQIARSRSEYGRVIELAQTVLQNDLANERAHQHLMFAHLASGNRASALRQYDECRRALNTELAVEPMPETTALYHWIRQAAPEGKPLEPRLTNLPIPVSSFIGRKRETAQVKALLAQHRLVTVIGAGGSGKTRLAVQVATDLVDQFHDGVWWVELAPLMDEALVPQVIAKALGVHEVAAQALTDTIASFISARRMLLILDNCEHLVAACARLADTLLQACPHLVLLATSREGLGITGEVTWLVPLLSLPETQDWLKLFQDYEAIRLFTERAKEAKPDFELTEQNALAVAQICRRLDGIPLAIELAAARVRVLPVKEIAARLDDRFNLLTMGSRTALPRQQTLRALIDWSYDLLPDDERRLLHRLSVFAGGWTLAAAEQVCRDERADSSGMLDALAQLVNKSLVLAEQTEGREPRYRFLETIRQYMSEKLIASGEADAVRAQHWAWCVQLAEAAEPQLRGGDQLLWLDRLELEHDNLHAALEWARPTPSNARDDAAIRLAAPLYRFWMLHGYWSEGREWLRQGLKSEAVTRSRATALVGLAEITTSHDSIAAALPLYDAGLALFRTLGDPWDIALASCYSLFAVEDPVRAQALFDESLALARELGDEWLMASAYHRMGIHAHRRGDMVLARSMIDQGLTHSRQTGDRWLLSSLLVNLGEVARSQADYDQAAALYEEGLTIERALGDRDGISTSLHNMAYVALHRGNDTQAAALFKESLALRQEQGLKKGIVECLAGLGAVAAARKQPERAAQLMGAADALFAAVKASMDLADRIEYDRHLASVREQMGDAAFRTAWEQGRALTLEQAVHLAKDDA